MKRYIIGPYFAGFYKEDKNGGWVKASDVEALEEEIKDLKNFLHQIHSLVSIDGDKKFTLDSIEWRIQV